MSFTEAKKDLFVGVFFALLSLLFLFVLGGEIAVSMKYSN